MIRFASACFAAALSLGAAAQWNLVNNTGYQAVRSITSGGGALYMVATSTTTFNATVFKSTDGGNSWTESGAGLPAGASVQSVHATGSVLLCGTQDGVYRSTNAGASWSLANTGLPTASTSNYAKKFFQFGTTTLAVYSATIGSQGGIYRSTDGGVQWFSGNNGLATNMVVNQVAQAGSLLYAATSTGLASSSSLAVTWNQIPTANFACHAVQGTASRLVVISGLGYRYSTNGGSTWTNATGAPAAPTSGELVLYDGKYWAINSMSPMDVLRSVDNGASYSVYEGGLQGADAIAQNCFGPVG
ncbi:MAG: WD40/YVTN/BNR-like repeat-containing protein, partial [Flavobacteriales bacterium]